MTDICLVFLRRIRGLLGITIDHNEWLVQGWGYRHGGWKESREAHGSGNLWSAPQTRLSFLARPRCLLIMEPLPCSVACTLVNSPSGFGILRRLY